MVELIQGLIGTVIGIVATVFNLLFGWLPFF